MKISERQQFSIKCECIIIKNDIQINGKKKSKFSSISLNQQKKLVAVQPFGSQKDEDLIHFEVKKLKAIHKKYIEQGKLTLEFVQKTQRVALKGINMVNNDELQEITSQILISSASKENLQLLITKIVALKSPQQRDSKNTKPIETKQHIKKTPSDLIQIEQKKSGILNRKELMKKAMMGDKPKMVTMQKKERARINFFDLPCGIIDAIFQYSTLSLSMRVICRRFSQYILKNITSIRLKEEVDQKTFNKLSKWAIQVSCRMKYVKNIELADKYEQPQLLKNRAKTLRFGSWKEITSKNILQLKGLRIFCLEIPYHIKFDLSNLFGVRMVELRLKSSQIGNSRCEFVKTQDLVYLLKTIKDLKVLELPFANSDLIASIQHPKKMTQIKIYYLNDNAKDQSWKDLTKFQNMKIFSLWHFQKLGIKKQNHEVELTFPNELKQLQIGQFLSQRSLEKLPLSLQYLKLLGQNYFNSHIEKMYLPNLKLLDITMSRNIRQDILEYIQDISIVTFWDRNTIDFVSNYARSKQIRVSTANPGFK